MTPRAARHQAFHQAAPLPPRYGPLPPPPFIFTTTTNHPTFCPPPPPPPRFVQLPPPPPPLASSSRPHLATSSQMSGPAPPGLWPPFARIAPSFPPRPITMSSFSDPEVGRARTVIYAQPLRCGPCREQLVYQVMGKYGPVYRCFPMPVTEDSASVSPSAVAVIYYNPSDAHRALNCFPSDRFLYGLNETTVSVPTGNQMNVLCWQLRYVDPGLLMAGIPEVLAAPQPVPSFWFPEPSSFVYSSAFVQPIPCPHPGQAQPQQAQHHTTKIVFGPPVTSPMATPATATVPTTTTTAKTSPSCPATNTSVSSSDSSSESSSSGSQPNVDSPASSPSNSTTSTTSSSSLSLSFDEVVGIRPVSVEDSSQTPTMPTTFRRGSLRDSRPKKLTPVFDDGFEEEAENTYSSSSTGSSLLSPRSPSSEESGITSGYGSESDKKSQEDEQPLSEESLSVPSERNVVTQEDVLKRFLDSKAKPRKPAFSSAPRKRLPSIYDGKNIVNGIHLPKHAVHLFAKNNQRPSTVASIAPTPEEKPKVPESPEDDSISKYVKELTRAPPPVPGAIALREEHNRLLRQLNFGRATSRKLEKDAATMKKLYASCNDVALRELADLLRDGSWQGVIDLTGCTSNRSKSVKFTVLVRADTLDITEHAIVKFVPLDPKFELIPLRPYFSDEIGVIRVLVKPLSNDVIGDQIFGRAHCCSDVKSVNGLNLSVLGTVGTDLEFEVNPHCLVYAFQVRRQISNTFMSDAVTLLVPSIKGFKSKTSPRNLILKVKKSSLVVGESVELELASLTNYIVVCNSRDIVASGTAPINGIIQIQVYPWMVGECIIYAQKEIHRNVQVDMHLFLVAPSPCGPSYSLTTSATEVSPPGTVTLSATAPRQSLLVVRAIDERLNHIINTFESNSPQLHWAFGVFFDAPLSREVPSPTIHNFLDINRIHAQISENCKTGANRSVMNVTTNNEVTDVHGVCLKEFLAKEQPQQRIPEVQNLKSTKPEKVTERVALASAFSKSLIASSSARHQNDAVAMNAPMTLIHNNELEKVEPVDDVFLRSFFPEVWFFDDLEFREKISKSINLTVPHSIGEFAITSAFWSPGQRETCAAPPLSIRTTRHVFMEVIMPERVFLNETITAKVIIHGDIFENEAKLSLCFTGQSPVVCANMGPDGNMAETEFNRVILSREHPQAVKQIDLKFFNIGPQNVSFELRTEENVQGMTTDHCSVNGATAYDQIVKTVIVEPIQKREEDYACVVIYAQHQVFKSLQNRTSSRQGVIHFKQHAIENGVETSIILNPDDEILYMALEFEQYIEGFPLKGLTSELGLPLQSRRSTDSQAFAPLLMDFAAATYGFKQALLNDEFPEGSLRREAVENNLARLRSEIYTFSNCTGREDEVCAFGKFAAPSTSMDASIVHTATVASLMCENDLEDRPVCSVLQYLLNAVNSSFNGMDLDFHGQMDFRTANEREWFIRGMIVQTFTDCASRTCLQDNNITKLITKFRDHFYEYKMSDDSDLRIVAAVAVSAPTAVKAPARQHLLRKYDSSRMPYWQASYSDVVQKTSSDVVVNSLALLAYVNQSQAIYSHYQKYFSLEGLCDWILEQQDDSGRLGTALETFYAWRALYRYNERVLGPAPSKSVQVTLEGSMFNTTTFYNHDMPISIQVPASERNISLRAHGEGKLMVGVRVFTAGRRRLKRDDTDIPPIQITSLQKRVKFSNHVNQTICFTVNRGQLKHLEVKHRLYTGFTTKKSFFELLRNTTVKADTISIEGNSVYLVLSNFVQHQTFCYVLMIEEPAFTYNPEFLAAVRVDANYNAIRASHFLEAKNFSFLKRRRRRYLPTREFRSLSYGQRRFLREVDESDQPNSIDAICLDHGMCTCAELTCDQLKFTCTNGIDPFESVKESLKQPDRFGAVVEFDSITNFTKPDGTSYCVARVTRDAFYAKRDAFGCYPGYKTFNLWIRDCTDLCSRLRKDSKYMIVGNANGFFGDNVTPVENHDAKTSSTQVLMMNYLLRNGDFLEGGSPDDVDDYCNSFMDGVRKLPRKCAEKPVQHY